VRSLTTGVGPTARPVFDALLWIGAILVVFATVAVRLYRRTV
jgi:hypothetical protein